MEPVPGFISLPAQPLCSWITLGHSLNLSVPLSAPVCSVGISIRKGPEVAAGAWMH